MDNAHDAELTREELNEVLNKIPESTMKEIDKLLESHKLSATVEEFDELLESNKQLDGRGFKKPDGLIGRW